MLAINSHNIPFFVGVVNASLSQSLKHKSLPINFSAIYVFEFTTWAAKVLNQQELSVIGSFDKSFHCFLVVSLNYGLLGNIILFNQIHDALCILINIKVLISVAFARHLHIDVEQNVWAVFVELDPLF